MSNVSQFYSKQDIQEKACLWISQMDRGLSALERRELVVWINQNKSHYSTLLEMATYWDDLSVLNELSGLFPLEKMPKKQRNIFTSIAIAASFIFVSLLGTQIFINESFNPFATTNTVTQVKTYRTNVGEQTRFLLPDGTSMQLNTNSVVEIAFTPSHRQLKLTQGEARFDVAKDKTRPFTVTSGDKSFTALGTIFNVQKNSNIAMELVVTEGRVLITAVKESLAKITNELSLLPKNKLPGVLVIAGEKAIVIEDITQPIETISLDQQQKELAWQQGMLIFDGAPLINALTEISRYTATRFEITDPRLANVKVAGYFKAGDIDGLLTSLNSNFNITHIKGINNTIKLMRSPQ